MVLCLSESYTGQDFTNLYAIDPVKGEKLSIDIDLNLSITDIQSALDGETWDDECWKCAIDSLFVYIGEVDFKREKERVIRDAVKDAIESCDAEPGEDLSEDQAYQFTEKIMAKLTPFFQHNAERLFNASNVMSDSSE